MQYLDVVAALAAVGGLCVFLNRRCGVAGGRTPLPACSFIVLWLTVFGIAGALRVGGLLLYAAAAVCWVVGLLPGRELYHRKAPLWDMGFAAFAVFVFAAAVLFAVRKPLFARWDEMSFWGTACKLVSQDDALYTKAQVGWDWVGAQQPGAIMASYFMQFFGKFAPWKTFLAYDMLQFAAYSAVISGVCDREEDGWHDYPLGAAAALLCVLAPYLLTIPCRLLDVSFLYINAYGDVPAGILAGGAVAWYFAAVSGRAEQLAAPRVRRGTLVGSGLALACAGIIKENAFPVVLIAAGIIAADLLWCSWIRPFGRRLLCAACVVAAPMASYLLWSRHVASVVAQRVTEGEVGATSLPLTQVVMLGFAQLLHPAQRSPEFTQVLTDMAEAFRTTRLTLVGSVAEPVLRRLPGLSAAADRLGTGGCVVLLCLGMFLLAFLFEDSAAARRRVGCTAALSVLGFVGYYWVLVLSYSFIFRAMQRESLADYDRYVTTYYIFWFLLALVTLIIAARKRRHCGLLTGIVLAAALVALLTTGRAVRPQMSALAWPESTYAVQREYERSADVIRRQAEGTGETGSIFFVDTGDNGERYFNYCYQLLPLQTDYSFGGGPMGSAADDDGSLYYHSVSREELETYLQERDCGFIFLHGYDDAFRREYTPLFVDALAAADAGETQLYVRDRTADGLCFVPVKEG